LLIGVEGVQFTGGPWEEENKQLADEFKNKNASRNVLKLTLCRTNERNKIFIHLRFQ
jgi:hypothetical protein